MADISSFKIETPKHLDSIFSLECFKYNEMKGLFKQIYEYLTRVGVKLGDIDNKLASIPDFDSITNMLKDFDRRLKDLEKRTSKNESSIVDHSNTLLKSVEDIQALYLKDSDLESRITAAEEEIELLKNRPIGGGDVDLSGLATSQSLFDLLDRVKLVEKRNIEQDDRLTNNELRIEKLEKLISDPMERIMALERRCDNIQVDLNNKVSVSDLYNELLKKADINGLKALEASLLRLNDLINDLMNQFADKVENDKAHKLLQKNLKNLYDLFMSLKGDGNEDDPMFTAKGLFCASCTKGV